MPGAYLLTLGAGLDALVALRDGPTRLAALSDRIGRNQSATYRIVRTMVQHGFVSYSSETGEYRLTPLLWELGAASLPSDGLHAVGRDAAQRLVDRFGESVNMAIYDRGRAVFVDKVDGTHPIRMVIAIGSSIPAHCVAAGKVLLAFRPWEHVARDLTGRGLAHYTDATVADLDVLAAQLARIREQGYAVSDGEWRVGVCGLSVPVRDHTGAVIAALGMSGPVDRMRPQIDELAAALKEAAHDIERRLGHVGDEPTIADDLVDGTDALMTPGAAASDQL